MGMSTGDPLCRRKKGGNNSGVMEVRKGGGLYGGLWGGAEKDGAEKAARGNPSAQQTQPRSNKRRGRRGGRGRKHADRDAASEVPKLEK